MSRRFLLLGLVVSICGISGSCAPIGPPKSSPENPFLDNSPNSAVTMETFPPDLQGQIEVALDVVKERDLLMTHGFWTVIHGILGNGLDATLRDPRTNKKVNAVEYICDGGEIRGLKFIPKEMGVDVQLGPTFDGQGHQDQFVAEIAQCGLPRDQVFWVNVDSQTYERFVEAPEQTQTFDLIVEAGQRLSVNVEPQSNSLLLHLKVRDASGKLVEEKKAENPVEAIDLSKLKMEEGGLYKIEVRSLSGQGGYKLTLNLENQYTFEDMLRYTKARASTAGDQELSWTLVALSEYYGTDFPGFENMVRYELSQPINSAACGGTHRLFGLTWARQVHLRNGGKETMLWKIVHEKLEKHKFLAQRFQNADGSFSTEYFARPGNVPDIDRRIGTTGHIVEWLATYLPDEELRSPWMEAAVKSLTKTIWDNRKKLLDAGSLYHAAHGLRIYHRRVFGDGNAVQQPPMFQVGPG